MIAYLVHRFPVATQTFTYDEVVALSAMAPARVYSFRRGEQLGWPTAPLEIRVMPAPSLRLLLAVLPWLIRAPHRLVRAASWAAFGPFPQRPTRRQRLAGLLSLPRGALLAAEPDVAGYHAQFANETATTAMIASHLSGRPFSFRSHGGPNPQLLGEKLRRATLVLAISEYERSALLEQEAGAKIVVSRLGVDLPPAPSADREPELVVAVGSLIEKKGHHVLLDACARLAARGAAVRCEIAGEGPAREQLERQISDLGLQEHVRLLGRLDREAVAALLGRAAVFVMPSVSSAGEGEDGLPVALLEALASAVPAVATAIAALPEAVVDEDTGLLVSPGDADALADAIGRLLADPAAASRLGARGRAKVDAEYDAGSNYRAAAALLAGLGT